MQPGADHAAMHAAVLTKLFVNKSHHVTGNRESQSLATAGFGKNERVDANEFAMCIHQWTAAVPRVDRRVGLNEHGSNSRVRLPRHRADDSHGHGIFQTLRIAKGENKLPLF